MSWLKRCMPIFPDYLDDIHHPELRKAIPPQTTIVVYHGTSSKKLARILQHGSLDPQISGQVENKSYPGASEGIFVTISSSGFFGAELFAWHASQHEAEGDGGDPVILELAVPIGWIETDPDDYRIIDGDRNQAAKTQGRILRPVSIKNIKGVQIKNDRLASEAPYGSEDIFDRDKTKWMPIGKMVDIIQKVSPSLSEEYQQIAGNRPRGLSRSEPVEEYEQKIADKLLQLYHTFISIGPAANGMSAADAALTWVYNNKRVLSGNAMKTIETFFEHMQPGSFEYYKESAPDEYRPRPGEFLGSFLHRI